MAVNIEIETLRRLLRYEPDTGNLYWRDRSGENGWNGRLTGKQTMRKVNNYGYHVGIVLGKERKAHRVIWALYYGEWPDCEIDHINGDKKDNRITNLRLADRQMQMQNCARPVKNKSGVAGVSWDAANSKWRASIQYRRRCVNLGRYARFEDACAARKAAEEVYGFHENHGRAAS